MEYSLRHHGIVTGISSRTLSVSIASGADCAGCAVKSVCHPSGKPQDEIIVKAAIPRSERTRNFNIGDKVEISISTSKRMKAIFLALALPCLLLVCGTFTAIWLGTPHLSRQFFLQSPLGCIRMTDLSYERTFAHIRYTSSLLPDSLIPFLINIQICP